MGSCGTCRWWKVKATKEVIVPAGACSYRVPMWAIVDREYYTPDYLLATEGTDCHTYEPIPDSEEETT